MIPQEARTGFEPVIRVLQTHALPLGYRAIFYCMHWNTKYSRSDPNEIRTRVTAVKGRCLNRLTMGPYYLPSLSLFRALSRQPFLQAPSLLLAVKLPE